MLHIKFVSEEYKKNGMDYHDRFQNDFTIKSTELKILLKNCVYEAVCNSKLGKWARVSNRCYKLQLIYSFWKGTILQHSVIKIECRFTN